MTNEKQIAFTSEQLNDRVIFFEIVVFVIRAYRERNLKEYYYNVQNYFSHIQHFINEKDALELQNELDNCEGIVNMGGSNTQQLAREISRKRLEAFKTIRNVYLRMNRKLQNVKFFKKMYIESDNRFAGDLGYES